MLRPLALLGVALTATSSTAVAQTVRGVAGVLETGEPIRGAVIVLIGPDGRPYDAAMSDARGAFALQAPADGHYLIQAYAPGFAETRSSLVDLASDRTLEVRINLRPVAVRIGGVTVYGPDRYGGFQDRRVDMRQNFRYRSFDHLDIARIGAGRLLDVIQEVPLSRGRCFTYWLDGRRLDENDWLLDWLLGNFEGTSPFPVTSFYGVEVFRNRGEAPREYSTGGSAHCGVVLVWTRALRGRRE